MGTYGGANSFPALLTIPSDGEAKDVASILAALEGLADRTSFLQILLAGGGAVALTNVTLNGTSTIAGVVLGDGSVLVVSQVGETLLIRGDAHFTRGAVFDAGFIARFNGSAQLNGTVELLTGNVFTIDPGATLQIQGTLLLAAGGVIQPSGAGHIADRPPLTPAAGDFTVGIDDADSVILPNQTANRVCTLTSLHATNGCKMTISGYACTAFKVTVKDDGGGQIGQAIQNLTGLAAWVDFVFSGGAWKVLRQEEVA